MKSLAPLLSLAQMPFLVTWFFTVRQLAMSPDMYPGMLNEGFLWFNNLSEIDPYFILPIASVTVSFLNISYSPNMQNQGVNPLSKYMKFLKFTPFFSLPIFVSFPAGMTMYWTIVSSLHLINTLMIKSPTFSKFYGVGDFIPGTILYKLHQAKRQKI